MRAAIEPFGSESEGERSSPSSCFISGDKLPNEFNAISEDDLSWRRPSRYRPALSGAVPAGIVLNPSNIVLKRGPIVPRFLR